MAVEIDPERGSMAVRFELMNRGGVGEYIFHVRAVQPLALVLSVY